MAQQTLNTPRETTHQRIADALEDMVDKIVDTSSASNINYDNTQSGLDADKVQGAVDELASEKVDKVEGKGLSTNDYTTAEKTKLAGIEAGAQVNTVTSVAGKTGAVTLTKSDVGLGNVDNTSDLDKPISTAVQTALNDKVDKVQGKGLSTNDYTNEEKQKNADNASAISDIQEDLSTSLTATGNPITIEASESNLVECVAKVEAVQDLHGYDHPWVGGAGKNKLQVTKSNDTDYGITTVNNNGTVTMSGTCTGSPYTMIFGESTYTKSKSLKLMRFGTAEFDFRVGVRLYNSNTLVYTASDIWVYKNNQYTYDFNSYEYDRIEVSVLISNAVTASGTVQLMLYDALETDPTSFAPYSNICPISGWDELNVGVNEKNLCGELEIGTFAESSQIGSTYDEMKVANGARIRSKWLIPTFNNNIIISCDFANYQYCFCLYDAEKKYLGQTDGFGGWRSIAYTPTTPSSYIAIALKRNDGATITSADLENCHLQVELGTTATTYEPYNGHTYTIDLDGTRYGGKVDVVSGVMVLTHGFADLGTVNWDKYTSSTKTYFRTSAQLPDAKKSDSQSTTHNLMCSNYKEDTWSHVIDGSGYDGNICIGWNNNAYIGIYDSRYVDTSVSDFKTAMSGVQLVYELATPLTIQLTPQQIRLLKGTNNIFCNTGDLSIKYYPDNVLGQLKGDIEGEYDERVETLETQVQELQPSLIFMSRERKNITSDLSRLSIAVAEQNLEKYGYKIGDYFTGASGYTYTLADYNTFKGTSTPYCLTQNHLGIVVDTHQALQWYSGDASSVGYNGSTLHTYLKGTAMDNIKSDFIALFGGSTGLEHLLVHSKLLTTAFENWGWQSNQYISALSEVQVFGSRVWGANGYQTGEAAKKLELFDRYKWTEIFGNEYPWLRDMSSASSACGAGHGGIAHDAGVTGSLFAVGLINFY